MQRKQKASACSRYYEKGKGYKPAESDVIGTWHGTGIKLNQVTSLSRKKLHQHGVLSLVKQYLS